MSAASNDPVQVVRLVAGHEVTALVAPQPASSELPIDPNAWRVLATAYHAHHFKCPFCIAAGRGAQYGLRYGVGVALWKSYQDSNLIQQKRNTP